MSRSPVEVNVANVLNELALDISKRGAVRARRADSADILAHVKGHIPTACTSLDAILEGGIPRGRIIEIFGHPSHGKSTLAEHIIAETQKMGGLGVLLLSEPTIDLARMQRMGVELEKLLIFEDVLCEYGFIEMYQVLKKLEGVKDFDFNKTPILFVWDTLANAPMAGEKRALTANTLQKMKEAKFGDGMMSKPRLVRSALRAFSSALSATQATAIIINQTISGPSDSGRMPSTGGGAGVEFNASLRIWVDRISYLIREDRKCGIISRMHLVKSKVCPPYTSVDVSITGGGGIDNDESMWRFLSASENTQYARFKQAGPWWYISLPDKPEEYTKAFYFQNLTAIIDSYESVHLRDSLKQSCYTAAEAYKYSLKGYKPKLVSTEANEESTN